jgi:hypothetical protein
MAFPEYRPTRTLFQYCSVDGFVGVLRSKGLWFSDLASANDPRELLLGYEHFMGALDFLRREEYPGEKGFTLAELAAQLASYHRNAKAYCCCFSLAADSLPMWGAYGANYGGLAIGFRPTAVTDMTARIQKVAYVDENTVDGFKGLVRNIAAQFDVGRKDLAYWVEASVAARAAMTALKHSSWNHEREVRLVYAQVIKPQAPAQHPVFSVTSILPNNESVMWSKPLERFSGSKIVQYFQFPFGRFRDGGFDPTSAIEKVVVGPNCPLREADVVALLQENAFENFNVEKSDCQIR